MYLIANAVKTQRVFAEMGKIYMLPLQLIFHFANRQTIAKNIVLMHSEQRKTNLVQNMHNRFSS